MFVVRFRTRGVRPSLESFFFAILRWMADSTVRTMGRRPEINVSAIPVAGVGGLGMLALAVIIAATFPAARWLLLLGIGAGAVLAAALIITRGRSPAAMPRERSTFHL